MSPPSTGWAGWFRPLHTLVNRALVLGLRRQLAWGWRTNECHRSTFCASSPWLSNCLCILCLSRPHCLQEFVLEPASRRKLSVHVEGSRPAGATAGEGATAAAAGAGAAPAAEGTGSVEGKEAPATAAAAEAGQPAAEGAAEKQPAAGGAGLEPERITELYAWKRRQQLYASFK